MPKQEAKLLFVSRSDWEFILGEDLDEAPKFFRSWGVPISGASFSSFRLLSSLFISNDVRWLIGALVLQFPNVLV